MLKKGLVIFTLALGLVFTTSVKGATLTDEEYARLRLVFSERRISIMSDEDADRYLSYDLENSKTISKYYEVTKTTNGTSSKEVTEQFAKSAVNSMKSSRASVHTTSYKNIQITATHTLTTNGYSISLMNKWLITPIVKSYDVIAMRTDDATVKEGTQEGMQIYTKSNGTSAYISYSNGGNNMVKATNGFGISMNLVDDGSDFECDIEAIVTATTEWATMYGSYQHAAANVTLAQSKSYTISHNGYGEVINFATGIEGTYDGMQGVSIALDYTA